MDRVWQKLSFSVYSKIYPALHQELYSNRQATNAWGQLGT